MDNKENKVVGGVDEPTACATGDIRSWKDRCVVTSLRQEFIRPWIRAYFANGNDLPLIIIPNPPETLKEGDLEYCMEAARFSGGMVFDCNDLWNDAKKLACRACKKDRVGWYTKKLLLHAVASKLAPKSWAWVDDDAEITGNLEECFDYAERAPGFICAQFYFPKVIPEMIDIQHPDPVYVSKVDKGEKICWNSLVFFHGKANEMLSKDLARDFPVEDDEVIFCDLYKSDPVWHDGFCDFSIRNWQANCERIDKIPPRWNGKVIHYCGRADGMKVTD